MLAAAHEEEEERERRRARRERHDHRRERKDRRHRDKESHSESDTENDDTPKMLEAPLQGSLPASVPSGVSAPQEERARKRASFMDDPVMSGALPPSDIAIQALREQAGPSWEGGSSSLPVNSSSELGGKRGVKF